MMLTDLADACRSSGLPVVELDGWRSCGRPASTGDFNPIGVACHHTGSTSETQSYAEWLARDGRSDLPAPLAQLALAENGTVYVCAAGRANHAGGCRAFGGWLPQGDGNELLLGIKAYNSGFEAWSDRQFEAYHRLCAALCDHYGWPRSHVLAHAESSTTGKWDPGYDWNPIDMNAFRRSVAAVGTTPALPPEEEQMDAADFERIRNIVESEVAPVRKAVHELRTGQRQRDQADARRDVALLTAIEADLPETGLTRQQVSQALEKCLRRRAREEKSSTEPSA